MSLVTRSLWFELLSIVIISCLLPGVCLAQTAEPRWKTLQQWEAPEAVQAAAADERHFYAISSTQVAKYDRTTGERVGLSSGAATHLNSGFLWQGKLYCAHSNFPKTPESSQIKVLDLTSLELKDYQDFGDSGGSLTWAVFHAQSWWCHFAHYGDDNARSFLVRYSIDLQEQGRWTYPAAAVALWGRNSVSGGIWRDGELWTTGHDDRLLIRLQLSRAGTVLEFLGTQAAPFTGQGIAEDPLTGGVIGIDRGQRQVHTAWPDDQQGRRLRVLSYNIHHAAGTDGKLDVERIAQVISLAQPDLVAVQEVDRCVGRSKQIDQPAELARLTEMQRAFGANIPLQGGDYGNMILSRFPIIRSENTLLPRLHNGEQRGLLMAEIQIPGQKSPPGFSLKLLATHFDHRKDPAERLASVAEIRKLVSQMPDVPLLLAGDLNATHDGEVIQQLRTDWCITNPQPLPTIPVEAPKQQIDFVLFRPAARWRVLETRVLDESVASDHRPILAVLELLPQP